MIVLIKTLQVLFALSVLVFFHELGHFLFAKIFGIRVDKFYLFFDVGGTRLFSSKGRFFTRLFPQAAKWETEYGIGWLPLGGYCKIAGMVDESLDKEQLSHEAEPWEFRSKPVWQRILVMSGGVINNFLLAILVFSFLLLRYGDAYISNQDSEIWVNDFAYEIGFRSGDRILSLDGEAVEDFEQLQAEIVRKRVQQVRLLRGGDTLTLYLDDALTSDMLDPGNRMFALAVPLRVNEIPEGSINAKAGLRHGDLILSVDGEPLQYVQQLQERLSESEAGTLLPVRFLRGGDTLSTRLRTDADRRVHIYFDMDALRTREYSLADALPGGCAKTWETISGYLRDLRLVFTPSTGAYKSVGSVISIGQVFPSFWNTQAFLYILAVLSIMLGVMNLLPIPALDGGHIVFGLYELLTGRAPSERFLMLMQLIGMVLLVLLMMLAFGNDIYRLIS